MIKLVALMIVHSIARFSTFDAAALLEEFITQNELIPVLDCRSKTIRIQLSSILSDFNNFGC